MIVTFRGDGGQTCRVVEQTVRVAGIGPTRTKGTMCRRPNGNWALVSSPAARTEGFAGSGSSAPPRRGDQDIAGISAVGAFLRSPVAIHPASGVVKTLHISVLRSAGNGRELCRVIEERAELDGQPVRATGIMCRDTRTPWRLVPTLPTELAH